MLWIRGALRHVVENQVPPPGENAGAGGGGGAPPSPPAGPPSFDDVLRSVHSDLEKAVTDEERQPAPPPAVTPPQAPIVPPVAAQNPTTSIPVGAPVGTMAGAATQTPGAAGSQQATMDPAVLNILQTMHQGQTQLVQRLEQMNAPPPPPPAAPPQPPSAMELARTFVPPERRATEDDQTYAGRSQAALLDHVNHGVHSFYQQQYDAKITQGFDNFRNELRQEQARAQQQQSAASAFSNALTDAVRSAGYDPSTPTGQFISQQLRVNMAAIAQNPQARGWSDDQWVGTMKAQAAGFKAYIPAQVAAPVPGAAPNLQLVQGGQPPASGGPPIGAGGTSVPSVPSNGSAPQAKSFNEMLDNVFSGVQKAIGG